MLAFHDINPLAPVHFMLIPKRHIASLADAHGGRRRVLGRIMTLDGALAQRAGVAGRVIARSSTPAGSAGRTSCTSTCT